MSPVDFGPLNRRCRDKFGTTATFTPDAGAGTPRELVGVYDAEYYSETPGVGTQTETAVFVVVSADIPDGAPGDLLTHAGIDYKIVEVKPDGLGMSDLVLNKA
jgi:hypothetical protein